MKNRLTRDKFGTRGKYYLHKTIFSANQIEAPALFLLSTILVIGLSTSSLAQVTTTPKPQIRQEIETSAKPNGEITWQAMVITGLTATTGLFSLATAFFGYRTIKLKSDLEIKLFSPEKTHPDEKRNAIIIVGIGGSGKTTLINRIFGENKANPKVATADYKLFTINESIQGIKYNYYIADCSGQNIGTMTSGLMQEQKRLNSPMTYGAINSIIIVVDIAAAPAVLTAIDPKEVKLNFNTRVQEHLTEWSNTALDAIFGLTGFNGLKYVCLFINKIDLLEGSPNDIENMVRNAYRPLIDRIATISRGVRFSCLIGSIEKDDRLRDLQTDLRTHSS